MADRCGSVDTLRSLGAGLSPKMGNAEILALHIRVIALENLVIALLASATEAQREVARDMAVFLSRRAPRLPRIRCRRSLRRI